MEKQMDQEWLERAAQENARFGHLVAEGLVKNAEALFGWLLVLLGGGAAYVLKAWEAGQLGASATWVALSMVVGWTVVAALLMAFCIRTRPLHGVWSDPENLLAALDRVDHDFLRLRQAELDMMQERITLNRSRNEEIALWLDRCRFAAVAVPVLAAAAGGWFI